MFVSFRPPLPPPLNQLYNCKYISHALQNNYFKENVIRLLLWINSNKFYQCTRTNTWNAIPGNNNVHLDKLPSCWDKWITTKLDCNMSDPVQHRWHMSKFYHEKECVWERKWEWKQKPQTKLYILREKIFSAWLKHNVLDLLLIIYVTWNLILLCTDFKPNKSHLFNTPHSNVTFYVWFHCLK